MTFSTFIPCKDERRETLLATVESALAVTDEVVVCDDGSAEPLVLDLPRVRVVRHAKAKGPAAAANTAAAHCIGLFLARLDCGDRFYMSKREQLLSHEQANCQASFSLTVDERTGQPRPLNPQWANKIWSDNQFTASSTIISRALFNAVGGYDETLRYCDDWDFAVRVQAHYRWTPILIVSGTATQWDGGHSALWNDTTKVKRWSLDHARVATRARELRRSRM